MLEIIGRPLDVLHEAVYVVEPVASFTSVTVLIRELVLLLDMPVPG